MADDEQIDEGRSPVMQISVVTVNIRMAIPACSILKLMLTCAKHS